MLLKSVVVLGAGVVYAKAACAVAVAPASSLPMYSIKKKLTLLGLTL